MRYSFTGLILALVFFTACKSGGAFNYSEKIVSIERSMAPDMERAENDIVRVMQEEHYDSLVMISEKMEKLVDVKLKEVMDLPQPKAKEVDSFRAAVVKYFNHIKAIFSSYKAYGTETDADKKEEARQKMVDVEAEARNVVNEMKDAQLRYAKANNFKIEDK